MERLGEEAREGGNRRATVRGRSDGDQRAGGEVKKGTREKGVIAGAKCESAARNSYSGRV